MRRFALFFSALVVALAGAMACGGSMTPSPLAPTVPSITVLPSDAEMLADKTLGSATAPNTIVEYVSFWCTNCATFHLQTEPQIKSQFVDTGRAQLIFRNLFLQGETAVAASLPRCAGTARFFDAADKVFSTQGTWHGSSDPDTALERIMLGFGMSQSLINSCVGDSTLQSGLIAVHNTATTQSYQMPDGSPTVGIYAVPAVIVNGVRLDGTNAAGSLDSTFAPTLANIQALLK
jgi:protein-disulfide isomerase